MGVRLICLAIGYCLRPVSDKLYYRKDATAIDIRNYGSGNAGTTNMMRTMGTKAGLITFAGDCLKCVLAVALVRFCFRGKSPARCCRC